MVFDHSDIIMVIDNDATSVDEVRKITRELITEKGWTPGQDEHVEPYAFEIAEAIGEAVWGYILGWFAPMVADAGHLGGLVLSQLGGKIAWGEVGRYYMNDYAEHIND